jgi:hypothetical protein
LRFSRRRTKPSGLFAGDRHADSQEGYDLVALLLDGKTFVADEMVAAQPSFH